MRKRRLARLSCCSTAPSRGPRLTGRSGRATLDGWPRSCWPAECARSPHVYGTKFVELHRASRSVARSPLRASTSSSPLRGSRQSFHVAAAFPSARSRGSESPPRLGDWAGLRPRRRLVASSMMYSSDQQLVLMAVVDNVTLDRKRSNAGAELRTSTTHPRLLHQQIESVDDGVNESVGGCGAGVLSDVGPDLLEVPLG